MQRPVRGSQSCDGEQVTPSHRLGTQTPSWQTVWSGQPAGQLGTQPPSRQKVSPVQGTPHSVDLQ